MTSPFDTSIDAGVMHYLTRLAKHQSDEQAHFVLVHPWHTNFWTSPFGGRVLKLPNVTYTQLSPDPNAKSICLVHNLPPGAFEPLKTLRVGDKKQGQEKTMPDCSYSLEFSCCDSTKLITQSISKIGPRIQRSG